MNSDNKVLLLCELDLDTMIDFLERCKSEGLSFSEKIMQLIQNFLPQGDNHLVKATA